MEKLYEKINPEFWLKVEHFCIPLQTLSQRILKLMNRNYDIQKVIDISKEIRKINPNISITTQFIY